MIKKFKITDKEPYKFTAKDGKVYDKCRYRTDSDVLDIFVMNLEVGQTYEFESVEKEYKGRMYTNWNLVKPKNGIELRLDAIESRLNALEARDIEPELLDLPFN